MRNLRDASSTSGASWVSLSRFVSLNRARDTKNSVQVALRFAFNVKRLPPLFGFEFTLYLFTSLLANDHGPTSSKKLMIVIIDSTAIVIVSAQGDSQGKIADSSSMIQLSW